MKFKIISFFLYFLLSNIKIQSVPLNKKEVSFNLKDISVKNSNNTEIIFSKVDNTDEEIHEILTDDINEEEIFEMETESSGGINTVPVIDSNECNSEECIEISKRILSSMDTSVNPCEDFYEFSCGGFIAMNNNKPLNYDNFMIINDKTIDDLNKIFQNEYRINDNLSKKEQEHDEMIFNKMKNLYVGCVNNYNQDIDKNQYIINFINSFNIRESLTNQDGLSILLANIHNYNIDVFFKVRSFSCNYHYFFPIIRIFPLADINYTDIREAFVEVELSKYGYTLKHGDFKNENEYNEYLEQKYKEIDDYKKYIGKALKSIFSLNEKRIDTMVESIIRVEKQLSPILVDSNYVIQSPIIYADNDQKNEASNNDYDFNYDNDYDINHNNDYDYDMDHNNDYDYDMDHNNDYDYDMDHNNDYDYDMDHNNDYDYDMDHNNDYDYDMDHNNDYDYDMVYNTDYDYDMDIDYYDDYDYNDYDTDNNNDYYNYNEYENKEDSFCFSGEDNIYIKTWNEKYPIINWKLYFEKIFKFHDIEIPITEESVILEDEDFKYLYKYLKEINTDDMANYIEWRIIDHILDYAYDDDYYNIFKNTITKELMQIKREYEKEEEEHDDRQRNYYFQGDDVNTKCLNAVAIQMPLALGKYYVENNFSNDVKSEIQDMVDNIKDVMTTRIQKLDWLDESTRKYAIKKLKKIKYVLGYYDKNVDVEFIYNKYKLLKNVQDDYFSLLMGQNSIFNQHNFNIFYNIYEYDESSDYLSEPPYLINGINILNYNLMAIPAAVLQLPLFDINQPDYINYGSIGHLIGHELTHAYDNNGKHYSIYGDRVNWWTKNDDIEFNEISQCFIDQYNNKTYKDSKGIKHYADGEYTLHENIADNGGLNRAYEAWKLSIENNPEKAEKRNMKLPGLSEYTLEQLFYISFAHGNCQVGIDEHYEYNDHLPYILRVNGAVSNDKRFAKAFNCPSNSPMNPEQKCSLW